MPPSRWRRSETWLCVCLFLIALFVTGVRLRLLDMPLERDEGEYAYSGRLMLEGVPPFQQAYNMKLPGTAAAYAATMAVLGQTPRGIRLGLVFITLASGALLYAIGRRFMTPLGGTVAASFFLVLSILPQVFGLAAHATHFLVLFALAGMLLLLRGLERDKGILILSAGVCFGLAVLMKQAGVFLGIFGGLYLVFALCGPKPFAPGSILRGSLVFAGGCVLPVAMALAVFGLAGVFDTFWRWAVLYARSYVEVVSFAQGMRNLRDGFACLAAGAPGLLLVAVAGIIGVFGRPELRRHAGFFLGFAAFSFLAVCPGLYFREHYWIVLLPAAGLLAGAGAEAAAGWLGPSPPARVFLAVAIAAAIGHTVFLNRRILLELPPLKASRALYGANPFPECVEVANYIRRMTPEGARVAVIGSEPQIPFLAGRRSATGYLYTYALVEPQPFAAQMQREMAGEIERNRPAVVVFINVRESWLVRESPKEFFAWFEGYRDRNLELVGLVDIFPGGISTYRWDTPNARPLSRNFVAIYKDRRGARR